MKILFIIDSLKAGGKERQLVEIITALSQDDKFEIYLILMSKDIFFDEIKNLNIKIEYLLGNRKSIKFIYQFYYILKKYKIDVVHTWDIVSTFYALIICKFLNIKLLNGSIRHGIRLDKFSHKFRSFLAKISPYVLANSEAGLNANGLKKDNKHFVLYNGINKKFSKINGKTLKSNSKIINLISVSSLTPYKDYFTVIKALKELKNSDYHFVYNIIGDGPLKEKIQFEIKKNGLEKNIFLMGLQKNVEEYLFNSDIFIHSSKGEGCSNVILEAMFAGLPIIASNTGGTKEIVTSENGFLFEYRNSEDLQQKIKLLIEDKTLRNNFAKNSLKIANENFTTEMMINNYLTILSEIKRYSSRMWRKNDL